MDYDEEKVDEMTLALLYLVTFKDKICYRSWKSFDWDTMDRLYEKGSISDPKSKAKSVIISNEAVKLSEELFKKIFFYIASHFKITLPHNIRFKQTGKRVA